MKRLSLLLTLLLTGCVGMPEKMKPVDNFHVHNTWGSGMRLRVWTIRLNEA